MDIMIIIAIGAFAAGTGFAVGAKLIGYFIQSWKRKHDERYKVLLDIEKDVHKYAGNMDEKYHTAIEWARSYAHENEELRKLCLLQKDQLEYYRKKFLADNEAYISILNTPPKPMIFDMPKNRPHKIQEK